MSAKPSPGLPSALMGEDGRNEVLRGMAYATAAYGIWGIIPAFWKLLSGVSAGEILVFRVLVTVVLMGVALLVMRRAHALMAILTDRGVMLRLALSALLIGGNWWLFIWAVNEGRILETSLGYYINPIVSIMLGIAVLGERLNAWQLSALGIAGLGVLNQAVAVGVAPWISMCLALSFALYGLVRKRTAVTSGDGLLVETALMAPLAIGYWAYLNESGAARFLDLDWTVQGLLLLAGPMTAIPLLFFAVGVRRVRLSTMGFLQYLAPTLSMLLAVFAYGEAFTTAHTITFGLIWTALALISFDALRRERYSAA